MKFTILSLLLSIVFNVASQPWHWRHVNAESNVYTALPNNSSILFSGDKAGIIKRSIDDGDHWEIVYRGDASYIHDVKFLDATNGFAVCLEQGLLLSSSDGGQNWSQHYMLDSSGTPYTESFHSIELIDASTFIVNGTFHTGKRALITTDKGQSFKELSVPGTVKHVAGDTLLAFGRSGFSFGIFVSYDLGSNWNLVKSNPSLGSNNFYFDGVGQVSIINSHTFFLSSNDLNPDGVFKTTDGGLNFTMLVDPIANFHPEFVSFSSSGNGIVGGRISSAGYGIYSTTDGGLSWTTLHNSSLHTLQLKPPFLQLSNNKLLAQRFNHMVVSTDGGLSFIDKSDDFSPPNSYSAQTIFASENGVVYSYVVTGTGIYAKGKGLVSPDYGMNWYNMKDSAGVDLHNSISNLNIISPDTALFAYGAEIRRYVRSGNGSGRGIYSGSGFGSTIGRMAKRENKLLAFSTNQVHYSVDRGKSWQSYPANLNINDNKQVAFEDFGNIYALQSTTILKSTDTGRTWLDVTNGINLGTGGGNSSVGIVVKNASEVIIYGYKGRLFRTTDGGQSWVDLKVNLPTSPVNLAGYNFRFMAFKDNMVGYAGDPSANGGHYVLQTTDGGLNWNLYTAGQGMLSPYSMDFSDTAMGYLIGSSSPNVVRYFSNINYARDTLVANGMPSSGVELAEHSNFSFLYPNPATVSCKWSGGMIKELYALDTSGKAFKLRHSGSEIFLTGVAKGMYFLSILDEKGEVYTIKLAVR